MSVASLAPPDQLFEASEDKAAFEKNRDSPLLVDVADAVEGNFRFRELDWNDLFRYVTEHREVASVLIGAPMAIRAMFGAVQPILELVTDPEEGWEELFIVIPTSEPPPDALERLKALDGSWFRAAVQRARFAVNITVEPRVGLGRVPPAREDTSYR